MTDTPSLSMALGLRRGIALGADSIRTPLQVAALENNPVLRCMWVSLLAAWQPSRPRRSALWGALNQFLIY